MSELFAENINTAKELLVGKLEAEEKLAEMMRQLDFAPEAGGRLFIPEGFFDSGHSLPAFVSVHPLVREPILVNMRLQFCAHPSRERW